MSGTNTSRRCRFHSATSSLTVVTPTCWPSLINNSWSRVAVNCCLPPVQSFDAAKIASIRDPTFAQTGRPRGAVSFRCGVASLRDLRTVSRAIPSSLATARRDRPSTSTL